MSAPTFQSARVTAKPVTSHRALSFRKAQTPAYLTVTGAGLFAAVQAVQAAAMWWGSSGSMTALHLVAGLALPSTVIILVASVAGLVWTVRVRRNSDCFPGLEHRHGRAWAWAGWAVPVASLFVPFRVLRDVRARTLPHTRTQAPMRAWWAAWLMATFSSSFGGLDPATSRSAAVGQTVVAVLTLVAAVLWSVVVLRATAEQQAARDWQETN